MSKSDLETKDIATIIWEAITKNGTGEPDPSIKPDDGKPITKCGHPSCEAAAQELRARMLQVFKGIDDVMRLEPFPADGDQSDEANGWREVFKHPLGGPKELAEDTEEIGKLAAALNRFKGNPHRFFAAIMHRVTAQFARGDPGAFIRAGRKFYPDVKDLFFNLHLLDLLMSGMLVGKLDENGEPIWQQTEEGRADHDRCNSPHAGFKVGG